MSCCVSLHLSYATLDLHHPIHSLILNLVESTRLKLWPYPDVEGSDYINANFVDVRFLQLYVFQCFVFSLFVFIFVSFHKFSPSTNIFFF